MISRQHKIENAFYNDRWEKMMIIIIIIMFLLRNVSEEMTNCFEYDNGRTCYYREQITEGVIYSFNLVQFFFDKGI